MTTWVITWKLLFSGGELIFGGTEQKFGGEGGLLRGDFSKWSQGMSKCLASGGDFPLLPSRKTLKICMLFKGVSSLLECALSYFYQVHVLPFLNMPWCVFLFYLMEQIHNLKQVQQQ